MRTSNGRMGMGVLMTTTLLMAQAVVARPGVHISGEVIRPEDNHAPVTIVVRDERGDTIWERTSQATRFSMRLRGDRMYTIGFSQAHSMRKDVVIDARHALRPGTRTKVRKVSFMVVLEPEHDADLRYAGPVGRIGFDEGSGRLLVDHRYALIRDPME